MKTKAELEQLKNEFTELYKKLNELNDEELKQVTGGAYKKDIGSDKNAKVIFFTNDEDE